MKINKKGEEMVEAAMTLPILILLTVSMLFLMLHFYGHHQKQIETHGDLLMSWDTSTAAFDIEKRSIRTDTKIEGAVSRFLHKEQESRIYLFQPSQSILLGELLSFDEE